MVSNYGRPVYAFASMLSLIHGPFTLEALAFGHCTEREHQIARNEWLKPTVAEDGMNATGWD
jgi:hypothetical protein